MNADKFLSYKPSKSCMLRAKQYNQLLVYMKIVHSDNNLRSSSLYIQLIDSLINQEEGVPTKLVIDDLQKYKLNAIAYGLETKDLSWKIFFLACYDAWTITILNS